MGTPFAPTPSGDGAVPAVDMAGLDASDGGSAAAPPGLPALMEWDDVPTQLLPERWVELVTWVRWLRGRYRLNIEERLPECWALHPELIEELTALKAAREEAYGRGSASGAAAVAWQQGLAAFLTRCGNVWARGCRAGHKPHAIDWDGEREESLVGRWEAADPLLGLPPDHPRGVDLPDDVAGGLATRVLRVAPERMDALVALGEARPAGEAMPDLIQWDSDWWVPAQDAPVDARPVWLRIIDPTLAAHLDDAVFRLSAADAAVAATSHAVDDWADPAPADPFPDVLPDPPFPAPEA